MRTSSPLYEQLVRSGMNKPYASQIASGARVPSLKLALRLYREIGVKVGQLKDKTGREITALERAHSIVASARSAAE